MYRSRWWRERRFLIFGVEKMDFARLFKGKRILVAGGTGFLGGAAAPPPRLPREPPCVQPFLPAILTLTTQTWSGCELICARLQIAPELLMELI